MKENRKDYIKPIIDVINIDDKDIVTTSGTFGNEQAGDEEESFGNLNP